MYDDHARVRVKLKKLRLLNRKADYASVSSASSSKSPASVKVVLFSVATERVGVAGAAGSSVVGSPDC